MCKQYCGTGAAKSCIILDSGINMPFHNSASNDQFFKIQKLTYLATQDPKIVDGYESLSVRTWKSKSNKSIFKTKFAFKQVLGGKVEYTVIRCTVE
jgi:hypothetical protein